MDITRNHFGTTKDGKKVDIIAISNSQGYSCEVITYGAYLRSFKGPDRNGRIAELTRNFPSFTEYENPNNYMGATIGRYANRIANASFVIDETTYDIQKNSVNCQLHGGIGGFHTKVWEAFPMLEKERASVKLTLTSPDGDQGYPGTVDTALTITLTEKNELHFLYEAATDKPTYISLTNHTYWNLRGEIAEGNIYDQEILIHSDRIVDVDEQFLPTGQYFDVAESAFDLRSFKRIGAEITVPNKGLGYDNNYLLTDTPTAETRAAAAVYDPKSGREMIVITNAPGVQFYSDNFSEPKHAAYCLETGELPDAMNHADFPQPRLNPGEIYRQLTIHAFSVR